MFNISKITLIILCVLFLSSCSSEEFEEWVNEPLPIEVKDYYTESLDEILFEYTSTYSDLTKIQKEDSWNDIKGKWVYEEVIVHEIGESVFGTSVIHAGKIAKGYNKIGSDYVFFMKDSESEKLKNISKGDSIFIEAQLSSYHDVLKYIELEEGTVIQGEETIHLVTSKSLVYKDYKSSHSEPMVLSVLSKKHIENFDEKVIENFPNTCNNSITFENHYGYVRDEYMLLIRIDDNKVVCDRIFAE